MIRAMKPKKLSKAVAREVLATVDAGLCSGAGEPIPGKMCVEAAVCFALGQPHGDEPQCVSGAVRRFKIALNDSAWSTNAARAKGMRRAAVAQLGSDKIDERQFAAELALNTARVLLPHTLRAVASVIPSHKDVLEAAALACAAAKDLSAARSAARSAANAADSAADSAIYSAAGAARGAARSAAGAARSAYSAASAANAARSAASASNAARSAANAARRAADSAADSAYSAAGSAAGSAARSAARSAYSAAGSAARSAARRAADSAYSAAGAARSAANAASAASAVRDSVLSMAAEIAVQALKKCGAQGVKWLDLCE